MFCLRTRIRKQKRKSPKENKTRFTQIGDDISVHTVHGSHGSVFKDEKEKGGEGRRAEEGGEQRREESGGKDDWRVEERKGNPRMWRGRGEDGIAEERKRKPRHSHRSGCYV